MATSIVQTSVTSAAPPVTPASSSSFLLVETPWVMTRFLWRVGPLLDFLAWITALQPMHRWGVLAGWILLTWHPFLLSLLPHLALILFLVCSYHGKYALGEPTKFLDKQYSITQNMIQLNKMMNNACDMIDLFKLGLQRLCWEEDGDTLDSNPVDAYTDWHGSSQVILELSLIFLIPHLIVLWLVPLHLLLMVAGCVAILAPSEIGVAVAWIWNTHARKWTWSFYLHFRRQVAQVVDNCYAAVACVTTIQKNRKLKPKSIVHLTLPTPNIRHPPAVSVSESSVEPAKPPILRSESLNSEARRRPNVSRLLRPRSAPNLTCIEKSGAHLAPSNATILLNTTQASVTTTAASPAPVDTIFNSPHSSTVAQTSPNVPDQPWPSIANVPIEVYTMENQRWYAGLGWLNHMLPNDPPAWSDLSGEWSMPKETLDMEARELPKFIEALRSTNTTTPTSTSLPLPPAVELLASLKEGEDEPNIYKIMQNMARLASSTPKRPLSLVDRPITPPDAHRRPVWVWVDSWKVADLPTDSSAKKTKTDPEGWLYGTHQWKGWTAMPTWRSVTRKRKWVRHRVLVGTVASEARFAEVSSATIR